MADLIPRNNWSLGINNRAPWRSLPEGSARDIVNLDPMPGGGIALRRGYQQVYAGSAVRGALAVGNYVLIADGTSLCCYDTTTDSSTVLKTIAGAGRFNGAVLNDELFFCTENETLRFKDGVLRTWGVQTASSHPVPTIVAGGLAAGEYQCAITFVDAYGDEGGTVSPLLITVTDDTGLQFTLPTPPEGGFCRLYVGPRQASTLYLQFEGSGTALITSIDDSTARLETLNCRTPVVADFIEAHNAVLLMADGAVLWHTDPMHPHLRSPMRGFLQFGASIDGVMSSDGGVFVAADQTFFIAGLETDQAQQLKVFPHGAVRGTFTRTADNHAAWMTRYGIAKSDGQGGAALLSADRFVPEIAASGQSGLLESNGNQLVVTTMTPSQSGNPLAAADYYDVEIVPNE
ncbi:hypothetical protein [Pseudomonas typographi]|uniref:hypothetical protein n=1 Tax=Pseudomonas typographi TaxID=2715964 RepID=UPI0016890FB9|nr:hypothetical protein [Pseudomonas typographi]MBD1554770.1 hypothetical protein [Pseudomonas typographi]